MTQSFNTPAPDQNSVLNLLQNNAFIEAEIMALNLIQDGFKSSKIYFYLGVSYDLQDKLEQALTAFDHAISINADEMLAYSAKSAVLSKLKHYDKALEAAITASNLRLNTPNLIANIGVAYQQLAEESNSQDHYQNALNHYQQALKLNPQERAPLINIGAMLVKLNQPELARVHGEFAYSLLPIVEILNNLCEAKIQLFDYESALVNCEQGLKLEPQHLALCFKYGYILAALQRYADSTKALQHLYNLKPDEIDFQMDYFNISTRLAQTKFNFTKLNLIDLFPKLIFLNDCYKQQMHCFWQYRESFISKIELLLKQLPENIPPAFAGDSLFNIISLPLSSLNRFYIAINIAKRYSENAKLENKIFEYAKSTSSRGERIKIGYLSPDFRLHPVGLLTNQIYGLHDTNFFEIHAYSLHKPEKIDDEIHVNIQKNVEYFHDVSGLDYLEIAEKINSDGIHILVDLAGVTTYAKPEIMALRPAPVQIAYLGYPGTSGADFIDYTITDSVIAPNGDDVTWSEQLIRLPYANCPFDNSTSNSTTAKTRWDFNLADDAVVLCCFNNHYKIEPTIFSVWMSILKTLPNTVLWLISTHSEVSRNLIAEANKRGVSADRLVFSLHLPHKEHLERYQLADLFLDTYWHNAHTTAIDALWQGLPVITCAGEVPSSRLAASLLNALEMPELITKNLKEYEELVTYYVTHHEARLIMRKKLKAKRYTAPLFDTQRTVRDIEKAYKTVWQRYCDGLLPVAFDVSAI